MARLSALTRRVCPVLLSLSQYRRVLVDWMCEIGEVFAVQKCTMHVAVGYLDRILQDVAVTKARLQLVAMCCLLIASASPRVARGARCASAHGTHTRALGLPVSSTTAKYEEAEENVPSVALLTEYTNNAYMPNMIHQMEIMVLTRLKWSLTVVTPLHYLGFYIAKVRYRVIPPHRALRVLAWRGLRGLWRGTHALLRLYQRFTLQGMIFTTDTMQGVPLIAKVPRYVKKYVEFFADLTLQGTYIPSPAGRCLRAGARRDAHWFWCCVRVGHRQSTRSNSTSLRS